MPKSKVHFAREDLEQIESHHLKSDKIQLQIESIIQGAQFTRLNRPCLVGDGIKKFSDSELENFTQYFNKTSRSYQVVKFVPASGAASRMFRLLYQFQEKAGSVPYKSVEDDARKGDKDSRAFVRFLENITSFAFCQELKDAMGRDRLSFDQCCQEKKYGLILDYIISETGLDYGHMPKGLVAFHSYPGHVRTAFEEHLVEASEYCRSSSSVFRVHFTVAAEFQEQIDKTLSRAAPMLPLKGNAEIAYSMQKDSTDTVSLDESNELVRDEQGRLFFRPGGHGALIENLNEISADIVYVKNIDNVVPDRLKGDTYLYKKALGGYLCQLRDKIFSYLKDIEQKDVSDEQIEKMFDFLESSLLIAVKDKIKASGKDGALSWLKRALNRPIRICGMVKNEGEPGGGPAWVENSQGEVSLQIVEKSQVDVSDKSQADILSRATHFNPVDLVCSVRDFRGNDFNLMDYVDPATCFISKKSYRGKNIKTFEWPGLWNGAMADWITIFVEVPVSTFAPVKTVNDLLRAEHQS